MPSASPWCWRGSRAWARWAGRLRKVPAGSPEAPPGEWGWEGAPGSDARPHFLCPFSQRPGVAGLPLDLTPCSGHLRGGRKGSWVPEGASERLAQAHRLPLRRGMKVMFMMCGDPRSPPAVRQASCGDGARPPPGSLSSAGLS